MYPTEIYRVCGPGGSLTPGIYHYDNAHHALARLLTGDVTDQVRAALFDYPAADTTNQFLLITLNFWKNSFKYSSFSYHVVAQDLGALLCSLRMLAAGFDADLEYLLWFQDQALNTLLGLEARSESVFAVIPLPSQQTARRASNSTPAVSRATDQASTLPFIQKTSYQRSKKTLTFSFPENAHLSARRPTARATQRILQPASV
jgi:SagB-type dehydrogenase family enzyme